MSDVSLPTIEMTEPLAAEAADPTPDSAAANNTAAELAEVSLPSPAALGADDSAPRTEESVTVDSPPPALAADQRASLLAAVSAARDLPPGVRDRLARLVEQSSTLDATGEPLLATRGVLDLLAQGLPAVLRREPTDTAVSRLEHPEGDAFFALSEDELSDQKAEQIARAQLQRAGLLR